MYKKLLALGATALLAGASLLAGPAASANDSSASSSAGGGPVPEVTSLLPAVELGLFHWGLVGTDLLSDNWDGVDRRVHLTAIATADATRVEWLSCYLSDDLTFPLDEDEIWHCGRLGEDTDGNDTAARMLPNVGNEAYELFWEIDEVLEPNTPDIVVLACAGDATVLAGPYANCGQALQDDLHFNEGGYEGAAKTPVAEIVSICAADSVDGPSAGATDPCQAGGDIDAGPGVSEQTVAGAAHLFFPFRHGATVPDSGFTVRVRSSNQVSLAVVPVDAAGGYDRGQISPFDNRCTLIDRTPFGSECSITAANMPQVDSGVAVFAYASTGCDVGCVHDSHYAAPVEGPWIESSLTIQNPGGGRFEGDITSDANLCKVRTVYLKKSQPLGGSNMVAVDKLGWTDKGHWRIDIANPARGEYFAEIVDTETCRSAASPRVLRP